MGGADLARLLGLLRPIMQGQCHRVQCTNGYAPCTGMVVVYFDFYVFLVVYRWHICMPSKELRSTVVGLIRSDHMYRLCASLPRATRRMAEGNTIGTNVGGTRVMYELTHCGR